MTIPVQFASLYDSWEVFFLQQIFKTMFVNLVMIMVMMMVMVMVAMMMIDGVDAAADGGDDDDDDDDDYDDVSVPEAEPVDPAGGSQQPVSSRVGGCC